MRPQPLGIGVKTPCRHERRKQRQPQRGQGQPIAFRRKRRTVRMYRGRFDRGKRAGE